MLDPDLIHFKNQMSPNYLMAVLIFISVAFAITVVTLISREHVTLHFPGGDVKQGRVILDRNK